MQSQSTRPLTTYLRSARLPASKASVFSAAAPLRSFYSAILQMNKVENSKMRKMYKPGKYFLIRITS